MGRILTSYNLNKKFSDKSGNAYLSAAYLRLWCRMTPSTPTDAGPNGLSPTYENSPVISSALIGSETYNVMSGSDSANQGALVTSTRGLLSFSTLNSGGTPAAGTDRPFSVSLWAKPDNFDSTNYLFTKDAVGPSSTYEYRGLITTLGRVQFATNDVVQSGTMTLSSEVSTVAVNTWNHIVCTYDGTANYAANPYGNGMKIYVNSNLVSGLDIDGDGYVNYASVNQDYLGMQPDNNFPLYIGQDAAGGNEFDGQIAEFALWSKELTPSEVKAIYNATKGSYSSGFISNPARILLQERDAHTGSYPTMTRTGDPDFLGNFPSKFDDSKIINFINSNLIYPTLLRPESQWVSGNVATPNVLQGLSATGNVVKGVSDSHVQFTPGENIRAFDDSRVYIDNNSPFFQTGSTNTGLHDFSQKLSSKTIITLDINPSKTTDVFFSTGTTGVALVNSASQIGSGLAYFNWVTKAWEMIGDTVNGVRTGSNVDFLNSNPAIRSAAPHVASGIPQFVAATPINNTARHIGRFHSTHGFPFATQYNSTGSQELLLTGVLAGPFLLEKAVLEWSGSFASYPNGNTLSDGPLNYQFMLFNVAPVSDSVTIVQDLTGSSSGTPGTFTTRDANFNVTSVKDLVWAGVVSRYFSSLTSSYGGISTPPLTYERDLNLVKMSDDATGLSAITGTFSVGAAAGIYGKNDGINVLDIRDEATNLTRNFPLLANKIGFRNFGGYVEGKSFIKPIAGINPSGSFTTDGSGGSTNKKYTISFMPASDIRFDSPYVLLPHHKLVLGFYGVPIQGTEKNNGTWSEYAMRNHVTTLAPGSGKLTLFGSLLRENQPVSPETNQPLTSDSIHESLHYGNSVFDQFDVEPFEYLNGTYADHIITGSMLATPIGDPTAANVRKIQAYATLGQAGTTGSLTRFVNLVCNNERYYDTMAPDAGELAIKLGKGFFQATTNATSSLVVATPYTSNNNGWSNTNSLSVIRNWYQITPYNNTFERLVTTNTVTRKALRTYDSGSNTISTSQQLSGSGQIALGILSPDVFGSPGAQTFVAENNGDFSLIASLKALWGFGDSVFQMPRFERVAGTAGSVQGALKIVIRGARYGMMNPLPLFSNAKFRRDRYGQFRDMLEQTPNAAYLVPPGKRKGKFETGLFNSVEYPIEIKFLSRPGKDGKGRTTTSPENTHSQNLSSYATSSLPYVDSDRNGTGVDRSDNPDNSLRDLPIIDTILQIRG